MVKKVIKSAQLEKQGSLAEKVRAVSPKVRAEQIASTLGSVVNHRVLDARAEASSVIAQAQADAEKIRHEADRLLSEVEAVRQDAKDAGYQEGRDAGQGSLTEQAARLAQRKEAFFANAEPDIIKLVLQCVEKVFGALLASHEAIITKVVQQAIEASIGDRIVVTLHPEDYAIAMAHESSLQGLLDRTKRLQFKSDDAVSRGGCVVETEVGTIDARLETQLKAIRKVFDL